MKLVMKKIFYFSIVAALLSACSEKESAVPEISEDGFSMEVCIPGTKTILDAEDYTVEWESGDALGVYIIGGSTDQLFKFEYRSENTFTCAEFEPQEDTEYKYYVLYPYNPDFKIEAESLEAEVNIESGIQVAGSSASHIKTPLFGKAEASGIASPEVALSHLATVIKVNVVNTAGSPIAISNVTVSAPGTSLSGSFSVNFETGALTPLEPSEEAKVSADEVEVVSSESFFLACSPFAAEGNVAISVNDGEYCIYKSGLNFLAGHVYTTTLECSRFVIGGDALPEYADAAIQQTLEDENTYAWRAQLNEGTFHISTSGGYISASNKAFSASSSYTIAETSEEASWTITESGIYRIVINAENNTVAVYSPDNDLTPKYANGSWADGSLAGYGKKPEENTVEVECLWMYGPFSSFNDNSGVNQGFNYKYRCIRSLADPYIFVYSGDELPRIEGNANAGSAKKWTEGALVFFIGPEKPHDGSNEFSSSNTAQTEPRPYNNSYAFGYSDSESVRNNVCDSFKASIDTEYGLREGQDDSRYAYFEIPEGCNYVLVDTREMTVVFRHVE